MDVLFLLIEHKQRTQYKLLLQQSHIRRAVRDKHVSSGMGNGKGHATRHEDGLRRDATGMKDGHFIGIDRNGITPVGTVQRGNANCGGTAHTDGPTVRMLVLGRNLHLLCHFGAVNGFHTHN
jgi:hypothetical protein